MDLRVINLLIALPLLMTGFQVVYCLLRESYEKRSYAREKITIGAKFLYRKNFLLSLKTVEIINLTDSGYIELEYEDSLKNESGEFDGVSQKVRIWVKNPKFIALLQTASKTLPQKSPENQPQPTEQK